MTTIQYTHEPFSAQALTLSDPVSIKDYHFSEVRLDDEPIYIQLCNSNVRNGICVDDSGNPYIDLLIHEDNDDALEWFESLDEEMRDRLFLKSPEWFDDDITREDIETSFTSSLSIVNDIDEQFSIKLFLPKNYRVRKNLNIYDENEDLLKAAVLNEDDIEITPLVELKGIKFDASTFEVYCVLRQAMVMNSDANDNEDESESEGESEGESEDEREIEGENKESDDDCEDENEATEINFKESQEDNVVDIQEDVKIKIDEGIKDPSPQTQKNDPLELLEIVDLLPTDAVEENVELTLKKPNEVYLSMWREARETAKRAKNDAIKAYLEAKNIKSTWLLDDVEDDNDLESLELLLENTAEPEAIEM